MLKFKECDVIFVSKFCSRNVFPHIFLRDRSIMLHYVRTPSNRYNTTSQQAVLDRVLHSFTLRGWVASAGFSRVLTYVNFSGLRRIAEKLRCKFARECKIQSVASRLSNRVGGNSLKNAFAPVSAERVRPSVEYSKTFWSIFLPGVSSRWRWQRRAVWRVHSSPRMNRGMNYVCQGFSKYLARISIVNICQ